MKTKKKIGIVVTAVLAASVVGASVFLYSHGNTKPYTVSDDVHNAIVEESFLKQDNEVRIMSSNLLVSYNSWHSNYSRSIRDVSAKPRAVIYFDLLDTYKPDVVGLQEMCDMWYNCLVRNDLNYKLVFPVSTAFTLNMTSLMYNADTTELIDKGQFAYNQGNNKRLRRVVWGLFKDKTTHKEYIVTSTHFDFINYKDVDGSLKVMESQMEELLDFSSNMKEKYDVPIFHVGDFNTVNNIDNWRELYAELTDEELEKLDKTAIKNEAAPTIYNSLANNFIDTKLYANNFNSVFPTNIETPTYDHIFLDGKANIDSFTIVSNPKMLKLSDHYSIFTDAEI